MEIIRLIPVWVGIVLLVSLSSCGGGGGSASSSAGGTPTSPAPKATVLVYMVGSNLESKDGLATANISQMAQVGSDENLKIVIETGGANKTGWTTVKRQLVQAGSVQPLDDLGAIDMADPATLQDFIQWAETAYPADKYHLILWDHGGGAIGGFGQDENFNKMMSLPQVIQAVSSATGATGKGFEVIGFDACLMATIEVADGLSPASKYLVASEETEPGAGWDYASLLSVIKTNPGVDGAALGKVIADTFQAQITSQAPDQAKAVTLSVTDLSKVGGVISALETLSGKVQAQLTTETLNSRPTWLAVSNARSKTESYGNDEAQKQFTDMADLDELATLLQPTFPTEAAALTASLTQAVFYKINGAGRPNAHGLSVYFPFKLPYNAAYDTVPFSSTYKAMVNKYVALGETDTNPPTFANFSATSNAVSATVQGGDIASVEAIVTTGDPSSGTIQILGFDTVTPDASGNVSFPWTGQWLMMNGHFVSFFDIAVEGNITLYDIPVLLNGSSVDILVMYDQSTNGYEIIGAWPGISSDGAAARDLLPINPGDTITPLFVNYDLNTEEGVLVDGTPFTVLGNGVSLGLSQLSSGNYQVSFLATDLAQNENESAFAMFVQ